MSTQSTMPAHGNTWDTRPENRYKSGMQRYHFDSPTSLAFTTDQTTTWMTICNKLPIAAGILEVNGAFVSVEGTLSIPRVQYVVHKTEHGDRGTIAVYTEGYDPNP